MYNSPIEMLITDIQHQIVKQQDEEIYQAVLNYIPNVDKEELIRALHYDRQQYDKGYADGKRDAQKWISVNERLPEVASTHKRSGYTFTNSVRVLCVCVQKDGKTMVKEGFLQLWGYNQEPYWKIPGSIDSVTHWMPLPEPPKEDDA